MQLCNVMQCYYFNTLLYFYTLLKMVETFFKIYIFLCFTEESNLGLKLHEVEYYHFYNEKSQAK